MRWIIVAWALLVVSCAGLDRDDQGRLEPQTVRGPCQVKKFYTLALTTVHTESTVGNGGVACSLTLFNPDRQIVLSAALLTGPAAHGRADTSLITLGRQAANRNGLVTDYCICDAQARALRPGTQSPSGGPFITTVSQQTR